MTLKKINILEYALQEGGGGGHSKAYSMYAFINVDNCERPLSYYGKFVSVSDTSGPNLLNWPPPSLT